MPPTLQHAPWLPDTPTQAAGTPTPRWPAIRAAEAAAHARAAEIGAALERYVPEDTEFVGFGSFARGEWTVGSDLDWTLLIDGQVSDAHVPATHRIEQLLSDLGLKEPGASRLFGEPAFSHELLHRIGGEADSNANTTRRILLILESRAAGPLTGVRERVLKQIFERYVRDDLGYGAFDWSRPYIPRFLLNDIVRYWRTVAVDFAAKRRARGAKGWALRRFKLRMARKLIFAGGLSTCFACRFTPPQLEGEDPAAAFTEHLWRAAGRTPLQALAHLGRACGADAAIERCLDAYDAYLALLSDAAAREHLENLRLEGLEDDPLLAQSGEIAEQFQSGLTELFLESDPELTRVTQRYAIF